MFVIVGLGNPGEQYSKNRHNVGFQCVKFLADRHRLTFGDKKFHSRLAVGVIAGERVVLAKPWTFMNDSGTAVAPLVRWHKSDPSRELLVIYDDLDLPFGALRIRANGSAGGQNGMRSIIAQLGTQEFPRLRVGIGRPAGGRDPKDYVLGNWDREQSADLPDLYGRVADAVELWLRDGLLAAMNRFNGTEPLRAAPPPEETNNPMKG